MKQPFSILRFASLLAGLVLTVVVCQAQEVCKIDQLVRSNGVVSIRFTDSRSAAAASTRALDATAPLNARRLGNLAQKYSRHQPCIWRGDVHQR